MTQPDELTQEHARQLIRQLSRTHQTVLFQLAKASTAASTEAKKASTLADKMAITVHTFHHYCKLQQNSAHIHR